MKCIYVKKEGRPGDGPCASCHTDFRPSISDLFLKKTGEARIKRRFHGFFDSGKGFFHPGKVIRAERREMLA